MPSASLALRSCRAFHQPTALPRLASTNLSSRIPTQCLRSKTSQSSIVSCCQHQRPASHRTLSTTAKTAATTTSATPLTFFFSRRGYASTTAATADALGSTGPSFDSLTWNRFLALRKTRRRLSVISSCICAVVVTAAGLSVLTSSDLDTAASQTLGLDPIAVLGLSTAGLACVGWLVGPVFGNAVFGVVYRSVRPQMAEKERAFYDRIKKHRVDPSNSSIANPVPDYYGEKIGSVSDYRRWLKDQRAFNLKRGRIS